MNLFTTVLFTFAIYRAETKFHRHTTSATIVDCSGPDADGLYGRGCSSKFMRCYNGRQYDYTCPKKLKFNVETAKCEHRRQVVACINGMDNDQVVVKAEQPFDCSRRKDGVYGTGKCSTTYYHCSRGHSAEMICPSGLYYNDKLKGCDNIDSIDECEVLTALRGFDERRESHLGAKGKYIERNLLSGTNGPIGRHDIFRGGIRRMSLGKGKVRGRQNERNRRTRQTLYQANMWKPKRVFNCSGMRDGNYALVHGQCSVHFWNCSDGKTTGRTCREGLFFNGITGKCDAASNISDCKVIAENGNVISQNQIVVKPNCSGMDDGPLQHSACSQIYYYCLAGQLYVQECPSNQVFDAVQKRCNAPGVVPGCSAVKGIQGATITSTPEISDFCTTKNDGLYSAGCKNYFYFCTSGYGYRVNCPDGLFFESETRTCDKKERVFQCKMAPETTKTRANEPEIQNDIRVVPVGYETDQKIESDEMKKVRVAHLPEAAVPAAVGIPLPKAKDPPFLPEDFDCGSKANGLHSIGCKTEYVVCYNGQTFFFQCPNYLIFDEKTQTCDYADNIMECSERLFSTKLDDERESHLMRRSVLPRKVMSVEERNRFPIGSIHRPGYCMRLNDGVYFDDCGKEYVICSENIAYFHNCPEGQVMDPVAKTCNDPQNIPACDRDAV